MPLRDLGMRFVVPVPVSAANFKKSRASVSRSWHFPEAEYHLGHSDLMSCHPKMEDSTPVNEHPVL